MNLIELFFLAAVWGGSFLFMRIAVPEMGPLPLIACRVILATIVLLPGMHAKTARDQFRAKTFPLFVVGITNSAIPFCLLAYSMLYVNAGFDSVLNATTPLWAAAIAVVYLKTPLARIQCIGLLLGLTGVVILVWEELSTGIPGVPTAIAAALLAPVFYGFSAHYSKRRLAGVKPFVVVFGSQLYASVLLIPLALFSWPTTTISLLSWMSVAALAIACTAFAYVLYFRLIENVGAAYAASVTFIVPIFGMIWGMLFLDEKLTPTMIAGCLVVLLGIALTSTRLGRLRWRRR